MGGMSADRPGHLAIGKDDRNAGPHDAGFFESDGLDVLTQPFTMVERHVRYQAGTRLHRIDRIEPAAHADLEHRDIHLLRLENRERCERTEFEIGQRDVSACRLDTLESRNDLLVGRGRTIDGDALVVVDNVRGRVGADDDRTLLEQRAQHRDAGPLAVGPCDVDDAFGAADRHPLHYFPDTVESHHDLV